MKECEEIFKFVQSRGTRDWTSWVARGLQAAISCRSAKHAEKLKRYAS